MKQIRTTNKIYLFVPYLTKYIVYGLKWSKVSSIVSSTESTIHFLFSLLSCTFKAVAFDEFGAFHNFTALSLPHFVALSKLIGH